jgi:hypothetical protein
VFLKRLCRTKVRHLKKLTNGNSFGYPDHCLLKYIIIPGDDSMGLMVILDDSVVMARKTKPWTPSRSQAAESFVAKLAGNLTPGSKMAVRDFLCKQSDPNKKQKETACLSHMLFEWAESPFAGLKEKLALVNPRGHNNPCAAAYS